MRRFFLPCLLCLALTQAAVAEEERIQEPADPPASIRAQYVILKGDFLLANIAETYTRKQNRYTIESVTQAQGLVALFRPETIRIESRGTITAQNLRPQSFDSHSNLDNKHNTHADFDWQEMSLTLSDHAGKRTLPLPEDTQDRLSAMYQFLFLDLQQQSELKFHMTNGSKLDEYSYRIAREQSVTVPLGTFKAIYVASPVQTGANRTEIWLAVDRYNFPCKMVITDPDGSKLTQVLTKLDVVP